MDFNSITKEELQRLYYSINISGILKLYNLGKRYNLIYKKLKLYQIPTKVESGLRKRYGFEELDTKEGLKKLCEQYDYDDICKKYHLNKPQLYARLDKFGVNSNGITKHYGPELDTKEGLEKLYSSMGCEDICSKFHINSNLLYRRLRKFGIPLKPLYSSILTKEWFEQNYYENKLSKTELAKKAKVSIHTINKLFKKYEIVGRAFSEAGKLRSDCIKEQMKKQWSDPLYVERMLKGYSNIKEKMACLSKDQLGKISSIQKILYSILDDLGIKYETEKIIGFWAYDCYLPDYNLIIECQGDYWHQKTRAQINDKAKATYLEKYFPYLQLKHIWEHEFKCKDKIVDLVKYWTKLNVIDVIDFEFDKVLIKEISDNDAKLFIAKYHYFGTIGKSSIKFGAFLGDKLISVCAFANLTRNESATRLGLESNQMRELMRFVVHPQYQKKNFSSWFISRCIKLLKLKLPHLKKLISFSDITYNHLGTIYKASNWKLDGTVKPDYWYIDKNGYVMHKKTLWDHACKMGISENDYMTKFGYNRIYGKEKLRFLYSLEE